MSTNKRTAPYGTWQSPITPEAITQSSITIADVLIDPLTSIIYHTESRPSEAGRTVIVNTSSGKDVFGKDWNARSGVHEYGGGAVLVYGGFLYFSHFGDGRVYRLREGQEPAAVTPENPVRRYADFAPHPSHPHLLLTVCEDHTHPSPSEVVNTFSLINTRSRSTFIILEGADFYSSPRFSPDGKHLAWLEWHHPDMPWEGAELWIAEISVNEETVDLKSKIHVAGKRSEISASYPFWASSTLLVYTSDESGYSNPYTYNLTSNASSPVLTSPLPEEFAAPAWQLGWSFGAGLHDSEVLFAAFKDGRNVLYFADLATGFFINLDDNPYVEVESLRRVGPNQVAFVGRKATEGSSVVLATLSESSNSTSESRVQLTYTTLKSSESPSHSFPVGYVSPPQPMTLDVSAESGDAGHVAVHVVLYPPTNPSYSGSSIPGEKPPCVVNVHGGPTGLAGQGLDWRKAVFTSRGWAWLDVNYRGSSGYGRQYRDALRSAWGLADVHDVIYASSLLSRPPYSLIDPKRTVVRGSSSGGYTVLAALCHALGPQTFAAGTSYYGIGDLKKLGELTHKFESRYLEGLIGGTYEEVPNVYEERSPVNYADKIKSPLLILQGKSDAVVPPSQATSMVDSIKKSGGTVECIFFEGEGHGFRKAENQRKALEAEIGFYERSLGIGNA